MTYLKCFFSFAETEYLLSALKSFGHEIGENRKVWIGLSQTSMNDQFKWSDGSIPDFEYFAGNQPDNNNGKYMCVE